MIENRKYKMFTGILQIIRNRLFNARLLETRLCDIKLLAVFLSIIIDVNLFILHVRCNCPKNINITSIWTFYDIIFSILPECFPSCLYDIFSSSNNNEIHYKVLHTLVIVHQTYMKVITLYMYNHVISSVLENAEFGPFPDDSMYVRNLY